MPNIGKKSGGKPKGGITIGKKSPKSKVGLGKKSVQVDPDDAPLNLGDGYEEVEAEEATPVEPFMDELVSSSLYGLTVIPRSGGEEIAVLHDFLLLFAKTEPFIGTISSKTSFMKKTGGRLL